MNPFKYIMFCVLALATLNGMALADINNGDAEILLTKEATAAIGYQSFSLNGEPGRAAEYRSMTSSPTLDLYYFDYYGKAHAALEVKVRNDQDYEADVHLSNGSQLQISMLSERFFHNLDHTPYDNGIDGNGNNRMPDPARAPAEGSRPDGTFNNDIRTYYTDHDPNADYGQKIDINEVKLRVKMPAYPAHLNLAYWRLEKHGKRQLRFADENCTGCHMQSRTRSIDRVTNELKAGVDGHFGYIDLEAGVVYREFKDNEAIPTDNFAAHGSSGTEDRNPGDYEHAEDPESTVKEITLRANTSPSGGLAGSASITLGKRENNSELHSIKPVTAETDYLKTSADVTYTPNKHWTINLRHRYLDLDNDNSNNLSNYGSLNPNNLNVRESIDFTRAWYEIIGNYRPAANLTLKAELRREDIKRDHTGPPVGHHSQPIATPIDETAAITIDPYWELPEEESLTKLKIGFHSRFFEKSALKISGWTSIERKDDPSYGTSFSDSRELFLSARYSPSSFWGVNAALDLLDEDNNDRVVLQFDNAAGNEFVSYDLGRNRQQQSISLGAWLVPVERLVIDLNYGYLATGIEQDLLFGTAANTEDPLSDFTIEDEDVDYQQTVHTLSAGATWQIHDDLSCRVEGYHIRSEAAYDPKFATTSLVFLNELGALFGSASSADLREISKIDIRQNGLRSRLNWQIDESWSCTLEASYDDYDEMNSNVYDGSVISSMASLSRTW